MKFAVGSLVKSRGREWVVLPDSTEETLILRPLGGTDAEVTGIHLPAGEEVISATFDLPDPSRVGDFHSCRLLREAVRLSIRSGAGPFRGLGSIAVEPRSYQLVPLLLALRLDPVRLLIADDVGIGKTVEASLIAKELLERGDANGLCVLVPPHLAEQWQRDLSNQFNIDTELVLASTAARLERGCAAGQSLFDLHRRTVVSMDFIKSPRRREEFLRACPDLVIVDEAHTCTSGVSGRGSQLRHELLQGLAKKSDRHILLVTATPHSGNEDAFRSLLSLLKPELANLPADLSGAQNEPHRRELARYLVQRRRPDIQTYLDEDTPFPERIEEDQTYELTPAYRKLFDRALAFARETIEEAGTDKRRERVRWWSALALLRSIGSSPAAAAATLRNRTPDIEGATPADIDDIGESNVLDLDASDAAASDVTPGADFDEAEGEEARTRRRLLDLAREADALAGAGDGKLKALTKIVEDLLREGLSPIVFCRFIPTAEYVAEHLRKRLGKKTTVASVTGTLSPEEREDRIQSLSTSTSRVLVCTDCLSEGINLQRDFSAVVHYDLSWNPTRHEQREGRVDRFGQLKKRVRTVLLYGSNSPIDGLVLDVLLRKHRTIRASTGVSVPVPSNTSDVMRALGEGLLLRGGKDASQGLFEFAFPGKGELHGAWDRSADREKRSRTLFAQQSIKPEEVRAELQAVRRVLGGSADVRAFVQDALRAHGAGVTEELGAMVVNLSSTSRAVRDALGGIDGFRGRFEPTVREGEIALTRTHPIVAGLAAHTFDMALDAGPSAVARRCGVVRTQSVSTRTTLLVLRERFHILVQDAHGERALLAEECEVVAFTGSPEGPKWLSREETDALLEAQPAGNVAPDLATDFARQVTTAFDEHIRPKVEEHVREKADEILAAHRRVRDAAKMRGVRHQVEPKLPVDVLAFFVLLPVAR